MKLLILCPGKIPKSVNEIFCFTDVINYYLPPALNANGDCTVLSIPIEDNKKLRDIFSTFPVKDYDAVLTLGLRYYSKISKETTVLIRSRFSGLFCQVHDGSRLDHDPVDITFTFKNDDQRLSQNPGWFERHKKRNVYMGWAADPVLNSPRQDPSVLRILVDHTNYGDNEIDKTKEVLDEIKKFVESRSWQPRFQDVSVRRFDSGRVVDVDLEDLSYEKYDRTKTIPLSLISKEHSSAHVFCVTHPESVGLVVLETAMAGAFIVAPEGFIPSDRLATIRHHEWRESIDWNLVLESINIEESRNLALLNSWDNMAKNIFDTLSQRLPND
jgi:hypothetical protein